MMPGYNLQLPSERPLGLTESISLVDSYFDTVWAELHLMNSGTLLI